MRPKRGAAPRAFQPSKSGNFCDGVLEEQRAHACCADAADFLLVNQHRNGGLLRRFDCQLSLERSVGAHAVVLAVADNHAAVEAQLAGAACRHYLDFGGKEVFFCNAVLFFQQLKGKSLYRLLCGGFLLVGGVVGGLDLQGAIADKHIEVFALDHFAALLGHLLVAQMGQKIGYAEYGVAGIVAHVHIDHGAVGFRHHTVKRQRQRYPLVVLDAAIVVSVKEGKPVVLVNRVLLQVQTGAVDVSAQDVQARLERARCRYEPK